MHGVEQGLTFFTSHFQFHLYSKDTTNERTQRSKQTHMQSAQSHSPNRHAYSHAFTQRHTMLTPHTDAQGYIYIDVLQKDTYTHMQAHAP